MQIFYKPDVTTGSQFLDETESKHCIKILRLSVRDIIYLTDGKGGFYKAEIIEPDPLKCVYRIIESTKEFGKQNYQLHIAIAPTKGIDRFEWFLEKATEIGIDEITPILCERSERRIIKPERLNKILISALKQSGRAYKPILNDIIPFRKFTGFDFKGTKFIAHCIKPDKPLLKMSYQPGNNALVMIGPEGDFTPGEIEQAREHNFLEVDLGQNRLRTETAGLVACTTITLLNQREHPDEHP